MGRHRHPKQRERVSVRGLSPLFGEVFWFIIGLVVVSAILAWLLRGLIGVDWGDWG